MRIGIVGAGAIGCLFGAKLHRAGHEVTLIHRNRVIVQEIRENGVRLRETNGESFTVRVPIQMGPVVPRSAQFLLVAVKAYDTKAVAISYRKSLGQETVVVSLQNGLGNVETLESVLRRKIIAGSTTEGALIVGPGSVVHSGNGRTVIGDTDGRVSRACLRLKVALGSAGFPTTTRSNIKGVLWSKAIVNAAINPLSGLTGLSNGALSQVPKLRKLVSRVIDEGVKVSQAEHVRLSENPRKLVRRILVATAGNKSSMLQDIERRKMTEIRELNGQILLRGKRRHVKTPLNEILTSLVLGMEESQRMKKYREVGSALF